MAEIEGENEDNTSEDELGDAFIALLIDIDGEVLEHSELYFTLVENLFTALTIPYAEAIIQELNN